MRHNPNLADFSPAMVAACNAALDAGLFYNTEFDAFVLQHMGGFGCTATLVEIADIDNNAPGYMEAHRALRARLTLAIAAAPRGHYAVLRFAPTEHRGMVFKTIVSDGHGDRPAVGGEHDTYDTMPTAEKVLQRMVEYEIYLCRGILEAQRYAEKCRAAMKEYGLCVGYTHKGAFNHGGDTYSTVTIVATSDSGQVKLHMTKRGSRKRWETWLGAEAFASRAGLAEQRAQAQSQAQAPAGTANTGLFELAA